MKLSVIQIFLAILSLSFIIDRFLRFVRREPNQSFFKFFVATLIWTTVLVIAVFPTSVYYFSKKLGMGESLNTLIFTGFVVVFMVVFKLLNIIERIEKNITEIIRREALKDLKGAK